MNKTHSKQNSAAKALRVKPQLVLFSSDIAALEKLKPYSEGMNYISYEVGYGPEVAGKAKLDAFWVSLMGGIELFAAAPPFPLHEARVLPTPITQVEKGFPRYGIVGVATSPTDSKSPEYNLRLITSALLKAIGEFNHSHSQDQIARVGILPDDLALNKMDASAAFKIIREVYEGP